MRETEEFRMYFLCPPETHDYASCNALKEYALTADHVRNHPKHMREIAERYGTTVEEMKKHWRCIK